MNLKISLSLKLIKTKNLIFQKKVIMKLMIKTKIKLKIRIDMMILKILIAITINKIFGNKVKLIRSTKIRKRKNPKKKILLIKRLNLLLKILKIQTLVQTQIEILQKIIRNKALFLMKRQSKMPKKKKIMV